MEALTNEEMRAWQNLLTACDDELFGEFYFKVGRVAEQIREIIRAASEVLQEVVKPLSLEELRALDPVKDFQFVEISLIKEPLNLPPDMTWYEVWDNNGKR